ncbi:hypothetical protein SUGI_0708860 [Cryptomeria japonica]|nr:hypothetical protein SUGI_0708860 [Cryptomeria japonica]
MVFLTGIHGLGISFCRAKVTFPVDKVLSDSNASNTVITWNKNDKATRDTHFCSTMTVIASDFVARCIIVQNKVLQMGSPSMRNVICIQFLYSTEPLQSRECSLQGNKHTVFINGSNSSGIVPWSLELSNVYSLQKPLHKGIGTELLSCVFLKGGDRGCSNPIDDPLAFSYVAKFSRFATDQVEQRHIFWATTCAAGLCGTSQLFQNTGAHHQTLVLAQDDPSMQHSGNTRPH